MAVTLSPVGGVAGQFFDNNGDPLVGGKLFTYAAGTTTPQATFTSATGTTPNSNPIILNGGGRVPAEIWLTDGLEYKFVLYSSTDQLIGSWDNIVGINSNFVNYTAEQEIQTATADQTVFTLTTMQYLPGTNSLSVFVDGVNQYGPGAQYAYVETNSTTVTFVTGLHVGASVKFTTATINSAAATSADQVSYTPAGTGAVVTNVQAKLRETVSVKDFGAVGDGVTDDTAAIQAAIAVGAKTIFFPSGTYLITSSLTQASDQAWVGEGGQRASTLKKGFNGDLMTMGTLGEINNLNIDGNGASFTGKNIVVPSGTFSQKITQIRTFDSDEQGLFFEQNGGIGVVVSEFEGTTTDLATIAPIGCQGDTGASPRFFNNVWLPGGLFAITGMNDVFISNTFVSKIVTSPTTSNYYIINTRFASSGSAILIQGAGGQFSNCAFAGQVNLANTSSLVFDSTCEFGFGVTEDPATCLFNSFSTQSTAYTPTWTQPSGTQPALGNGAITGRYIREGRQCTVQIVLTMGSTTTYGNNTQPYQFSLPFFSHNAYTQEIPLCVVIKDATGTSYTFNAQIAASTGQVANLNWDGSSARDTFPISWAVGDTVTINLTYSTI